jgi:superfamily II DNA or RNA helicase
MNQKDIVQAKCLEKIITKKRCCAVLGTGSGKTMLGLKHMMLQYSDISLFLVVCPTKAIKDGWIKEIKDNDLDFLLNHITFSTYLSLHKQDYTNTDWVYFDESHNLKFSHEPWLQLYEGNILALTGTPPKSKQQENYILTDRYFPIAFNFGIDAAIAQNMLNDYRIHIHQLKLSEKQTHKTKFGITSELKAYISISRRLDRTPNTANKILRMKTLQWFGTKVLYAKMLLEVQENKTLVFTDYTEQADKICKHTYHSKNKNSKNNLEMFKSGEITKLASVQQLNEGVNIPNLKVGIIMHSYANEKKLPQKIGRLLRLNPNDTADIHILVYQNTVDMDWLKNALKSFDKNKIFTYDTRKTVDAFKRLHS